MSKKLIVLSLVILMSFDFSNSLLAQDINPNDYPDYEPYVGTWVGKKGRDSLVVSLKVEKKYMDSVNVEVQMMFGKFTHFSNGEMTNNNFDSQEFTLRQGILNHLPSGQPFLRFSFTDLNYQKRGRILLIFRDPNQKIVSWKLSETEGVRIKDQLPKNFNKFSLPKQITLRKIN